MRSIYLSIDAQYLSIYLSMLSNYLSIYPDASNVMD